ncbi:MAG: M48 family metallopeptidase, partial [Parvularculaceae bacterium]|nr:M48 family metallopeptidase [Parvularculaceae bacterium]
MVKSFQLSAGPAPDLVLDLGGVTAPVKMRVDRRARRVIVRVDPTGRIVVTAPSHRATPDALAFAQSRAAWIKAQIDRHGPRPFAPGVVMPSEGRPTAIVHAPRLRGVAALPG